MPTNDFTTVDYLFDARERKTTAFTDKPIFDKYLQLLILGQVEIQEALKQVMQLRSIDTAEGEQLNVIGRIVGQPRELLEADLYEYFGLQGATNAQSFGEFGNVGIGGLFYNYGTPLGGNVLLDDATYRKFIRAKIFKNVTASTPEEFITVVNTIFDLPISITSEGDAQVTLMFGRLLTAFEKALLNYVSTSQGYPSRLIPKTVGVRINYGEFDGDDYFGFQGAPGAKGFGDLIEFYDPLPTDSDEPSLSLNFTTQEYEQWSTTIGYGSAYGENYGGSRTLNGGGLFATLY